MKKLPAALLAFVVSMLAIQTSPVAAGDDDHDDRDRVVVREGESIQAAIDAADYGTTIVVKGDHVENVWISKSGVSLRGNDATLTMPTDPTPNPCSAFGQPATLICVAPPEAGNTDVPPALDTYLSDVSVTRFDALNNPLFDAVGVLFTNNVEVSRNTIQNPGCDGVFLIFTQNFEVSRNAVSGSQCTGIGINASSNGEVTRNDVVDGPLTGIGLNDVSHVVASRNTASGNCIGISAADGNDFGYGIQEQDFPGTDIRITRNTTNANNRTCPFGPVTIGLVGIVVGGVSDTVIERNTANDNTSTEASVIAGGISVTDLPNPDGSVSISNDVTVRRNNATGNSSEAGPGDIVVNSEGQGFVVQDNKCGFGVSC